MLKHKLFISLLLATAVAGSSFAKKQYYTKTLVFPEGATIEQKADMASRLRPTDKQMAWQKRELTAFLHFGVNTFTNREWGNGTEDPQIFNPVNLDARQWVKTLKDAGFKQVILTAKHHDGFCLWQTKTTDHSVASSSWRNGKGDVLADLRKACDEFGMKLGVYLSPWDRNAKCYGSDAYNDMFVAQLTELLTNYGKIDEVWFDGACGEGPNGKKQVYDWSRYREVITHLQPDAVIAIQGDDVRWVGNEAGLGRETEWSATALMPGIYEGSAEANGALNLRQTSPDLGSRELLANAKALYWWPSEVDVSIRPGWFYHKNESPKKLSELANIYINSIGRNAVLLLNIPPTTEGLIASADSVRLLELKAWVDSSFADNLVAKRAKNCRQVTLRSGSTVNCVVLGENVANGQRVEQFEVIARKNGVFTRIAKGTTIGAKRILTFDPVQTDQIIVNITSERGTAEMCMFEAYNILLPQDIVDVNNSNVSYVVTDKWKCLSHADGSKAFDGNDKENFSGEGAYIVDMGSANTITGFAYTPEVRADNKGLIYRYEFYVSNDGNEWTKVAVPGEFGNIQFNPLQQFVTFASPISCRYVKFVPTATVNGDTPYIIADFALTK
jgi:alpha-L-fucosidase